MLGVLMIVNLETAAGGRLPVVTNGLYDTADSIGIRLFHLATTVCYSTRSCMHYFSTAPKTLADKC